MALKWRTVMEPGTDRFDRIYTATHRLFAAVLVVYALLSAFPQRQIAVVTEVVLFLILAPVVSYLYFELGRAGYEAPIPFVLIILTLGTATVSWAYYRLLQGVKIVPILPPLVVLGVSAILTFVNSGSIDNK